MKQLHAMLIAMRWLIFLLIAGITSNAFASDTYSYGPTCEIIATVIDVRPEKVNLPIGNGRNAFTQHDFLAAHILVESSRQTKKGFGNSQTSCSGIRKKEYSNVHLYEIPSHTAGTGSVANIPFTGQLAAGDRISGKTILKPRGEYDHPSMFNQLTVSGINAPQTHSLFPQLYLFLPLILIVILVVGAASFIYYQSKRKN